METFDSIIRGLLILYFSSLKFVKRALNYMHLCSRKILLTWNQTRKDTN